MPARTPCVKCKRVGLVRWEHVVRGDTDSIEYSCGACDHTWRVVAPKSQTTSKLAKKSGRPRT